MSFFSCCFCCNNKTAQQRDLQYVVCGCLMFTLQNSLTERISFFYFYRIHFSLNCNVFRRAQVAHAFCYETKTHLIRFISDSDWLGLAWMVALHGVSLRSYISIQFNCGNALLVEYRRPFFAFESVRRIQMKVHDIARWQMARRRQSTY